uniref:Uncharacterized protein n=1 Tax=Eutreptiella gymnastica TaxID=73025 RepID=A0A7S1NMI8_9EUGL
MCFAALLRPVPEAWAPSIVLQDLGAEMGHRFTLSRGDTFFFHISLQLHGPSLACLGMGILGLRRCHLPAPRGPPDLHSEDVGSSFMLSMETTKTIASSWGKELHVSRKHF